MGLDPVRLLRSHHAGVLRAGELFLTRRFVIDPSSGCPVITAAGGELDAEDFSFIVPEEIDDHADLHVHPEALDPRTHELGDRWRIYHGGPEGPGVYLLRVLGGRVFGVVLDPDDLALANPLAPIEPAVCKRFNADPARVATLCRRTVGVAPDKPLVVGLDPYGLDVRARFGIVRVEFETPAPTIALAMAAVDKLMSG